MRRAAIGVTAMLVLVGASCHKAPQHGATGKNGALVGTWELTKYGEGSGLAKECRRFKLFTDNQSIWFDFDRDTGVIQYARGGAYTFDGTTLTESKDYATGSTAGLLGNKRDYTIQLEGDTFRLSSGGFEETWTRVK